VPQNYDFHQFGLAHLASWRFKNLFVPDFATDAVTLIQSLGFFGCIIKFFNLPRTDNACFAN
jgi:hypothetical protein